MKRKVYILHEYIEDSCEGFDSNIINVSYDQNELMDQMKLLYEFSKESHDAFNEGDTYIEGLFAVVVEEYGDYHFRHEWAIEEFELDNQDKKEGEKDE